MQGLSPFPLYDAQPVQHKEKVKKKMDATNPVSRESRVVVFLPMKHNDAHTHTHTLAITLKGKRV